MDVPQRRDEVLADARWKSADVRSGALRRLFTCPSFDKAIVPGGGGCDPRHNPGEFGKSKRSHVLVERFSVVRHEEHLDSVNEPRIGDADFERVRRVRLSH